MKYGLTEEIENDRRRKTEAHMVSAGLEISEPSSLTTCPGCNQQGVEVRKWRLNTAYVNDEQNWQESCHDCYLETVDYYSELWAEYYAGCM